MSLDFKSLMGAGTAGESAGAGGILGGNAAQAAMGIDTSCLPSLTLQQRAIAFCTCFGVGMLISLVSSFSLIPPPNLTTFGVLYTIGNIIALFSTAFLFGPMRQLKNMFHSKRIVATLIYLATLIGTLVVAFTVDSVPAVICMIIVQFLALIWYTLSYIPYARDLVWGCLTKCGSGA